MAAPAVAQQQVAGGERHAVERTGQAHADMAEAAAASLDRGERTGAQDLDHAATRSAMKRTVSPGANSEGGSRRASNSALSVRPISCQPPGALAG